MPRSTRQWAQRKLEYASGNLETAIGHLEEIEKLYRPQHPEIADDILLLQHIIAESHTLTAKIRSSF